MSFDLFFGSGAVCMESAKRKHQWTWLTRDRLADLIKDEKVIRDIKIIANGNQFVLDFEETIGGRASTHIVDNYHLTFCAMLRCQHE
mmetsp:Transcript_10023/g.31785  ORF Transcript_10023/g.31785 Transcript_10023/m.31785 type:complete len:87 (+) Transcript_10023:243-503(+)